MDIITNPTMDWLPWVVLGGILAIGALIGFWNGWRTATYFFAWNIVFLVAGVLLFDAFYDKLIDFAKTYVPEKSDTNAPDLKAIVDATKDIIKPILGAVLLIVILLITNFLAFLIYWFVRKPLKRRMKDNKQAQLSNMGVRFVGAGVGVVTAFPIAVFATTVSSVASPDDEFNKVADFMTSGMSFTKFKGSADAIDTIRDSIAMMEAQEGLTVLGQAFGGNPDGMHAKDVESLNAKHDTIQKAMNNPQLLKTIPDLAKSIMPPPTTRVSLSIPAEADKLAKAVKAKLGNFKPYKVSPEAKKILIEKVLKEYITGDNAAIQKFMVNSGLFAF